MAVLKNLVLQVGIGIGVLVARSEAVKGYSLADWTNILYV